MRYVCPITALVAAILSSAPMLSAAELVAPAAATIGRNLQVYSNIRLSEPAPEGGLEITLTSDDPTRLLLATSPDQAGSKTIKLRINAHFVATPSFCVQAVADSGTATYTVTGPGYGSVKGNVTLGPSAIVIVGPFKSPTFPTPSRTSVKVTIHSVLMDSAGKVVEEQPLAGGMQVQAHITTSDPKVGSVLPSPITLSGGEGGAAAEFRPTGTVGSTTLSVKVPPGFSAPTQYASVTAQIELPGLGLTGDIYLGKDLQVPGLVLLGEVSPPGGVDVTVTSSDPQKLLLSTAEDKPGSKSITLHIPAGTHRAPYYVQALADTGTVTHTATATGYRSRTGSIRLAPSGLMVVFAAYGPPDEAEVLRTQATRDPRPFTISLKDGKPAQIAVWSVYLDPASKRGADITAQKLRPGVTPKVELKNSDPAVGKIVSSVTLSGKTPYEITEFTPLSVGKTVISIETQPAGFTMPTNAHYVTAIVKE